MDSSSSTPGTVGTRRGAARRRPSRRVAGVASVGSLGLAALWLVVVPEQAADATGWREAALRWGHSTCWAFLAVAAGTYALRGPRPVVEVAGWAGLASYAAFLAALAL